jgi:RNA-directed DNA polymerase
MVIRYTDDLVAICHSQRQAQEVKARIAEWLAPRGLTFNEGKTRVDEPQRRYPAPAPAGHSP